MSDQEGSSPDAIGRLTGKTTIHTVQIVFSNPDVERKSYFVIHPKHQYL
ncbi:hypothetical protein ES703_47900 [subsurface metagenome]